MPPRFLNANQFREISGEREPVALRLLHEANPLNRFVRIAAGSRDQCAEALVSKPMRS